ncbi:DUF2254 domain-containing protein [Chelativorans sp. AA-79]|uniref:DUF2254 domain-containing protein n=1 Tax=Chelativorans sp. AA-79 TaxID=3028735 RepID=UPI0023F96FAA|nr:DUF2254 domain-containing protein [Chelativorans sp. AA-79]WEX09066.1 DUF2254 domain-containing protein [Chelativorans sp. AA-79]
MDRIRNFLALLRGQLWAVPALFALAAVGLAYVLLNYGDLLSSGGRIWWVYSGDAGTARDLLGSLLSGLMTMTSLVVSVTFVILTLAANQLGPRLISIFMGDRQIQSVLGLFIGTILYVILVLRTLDDTLGSQGVPHLAVTMASVLTILCLLALLFYIHKIARSIIADNVVEAVSQEFRETLREILPDRDSDESAVKQPFRGRRWPLGIRRIGYVQVVDYGRLLSLACEADIWIAVNVRAGHFLLLEGEHLDIYGEAAPDEALQERIRSAFTVGTERTPAQDPEQGIRQLVEIATRALSPGTNDPFTAIAVIDRLGAAFEEIFARHVQPHAMRDGSGEIRVVADRSDIAGLLAAAFHPIRQAGKAHPAILIRMADVMADLACGTRNAVHREALLGQLQRLAETAALGQSAQQDRQDILARIEHAKQALTRGRLQPPGKNGF